MNRRGDASDTSIFNSKSNHMKKSTAQTIAIILLALAICTADSWFNF